MKNNIRAVPLSYFRCHAFDQLRQLTVSGLLALVLALSGIGACNANTNLDEVNSSPLKASAKFLFREPVVRSLAFAAGSSDVGELRALSATGIDINTRGTFDATPLYYAVREGALEGVLALLELGADPNVRLTDGSSPIWVALTADNIQIFTALLASGADPNTMARPIKGTRYKAKADDASSPAPTVIENSILSRAVTEPYGVGYSPFIEQLIKYGADLNCCKQKSPPVVAAILLGRFDFAHQLIEAGADTNVHTAQGTSLLEFARQRQGKLSQKSPRYPWSERVITRLEQSEESR